MHSLLLEVSLTFFLSFPPHSHTYTHQPFHQYRIEWEQHIFMAQEWRAEDRLNTVASGTVPVKTKVQGSGGIIIVISGTD